MNTSSLETRCVTCEHEVVRGVACDWQPEYCPLSQPHHLAPRIHGIVGEMLAVPGEYDAIRSEN
jgi:hypothetical protein